MGSLGSVSDRFVGAYRGFVGAHKRFGGADARSGRAAKRSVRASRLSGSASKRFGRASGSVVRTIEYFAGALEPSAGVREGFGSAYGCCGCAAVSESILPVPRIRDELKPALGAFVCGVCDFGWPMQPVNPSLTIDWRRLFTLSLE
ncbi:hypothetical protein EDE11_101154 [Methylomonas methanica]|uniref:Uncharacterized protein n=1 Tax=Methylomonas methanica TaxID=421 RepID=A0ABY2CSG6_METMH|nr:hypothetical protein EDE11_101154 [Methylomonas methanica]